MDHDRIVDLLNDLIHVAEDSHLNYQRAAEDCPDADLKSLLNDMSAGRGAMVRDLQLQVAAIGGAPEATGTILGQAHRMVEQIRSALGNLAPAAILEDLVRREEAMLQRFQEAAGNDALPDDQRRRLSGHVARITADRDRLRGRLQAA